MLRLGFSRKERHLPDGPAGRWWELQEPKHRDREGMGAQWARASQSKLWKHAADIQPGSKASAHGCEKGVALKPHESYMTFTSLSLSFPDCKVGRL